MFRFPIFILVASCIAFSSCKALNKKNGGTVHFDNDEVYVSPPTKKPVQSTTHAAELQPAVQPAPQPGMPNIPAPSPEMQYQNRIDSRPMSSKPAMGASPVYTPVWMGAGHPYPFVYPGTYPPEYSHQAFPQETIYPKEPTQTRINNKGPVNTINEILNKPEPVDVPQSVLEKKDVMNDAQYLAVLKQGITQMTLDLERVIRSQGLKYDNVVFAPLSIVGALALVLLGSDGATKTELTRFMGAATGRNLDNKSDLIHKALGGFFDALSPKSGVLSAEIQVANGVFYQDRFQVKKQYEQLAKEFYKSEIFPLDFSRVESAQFVNKWVSNRTNGKIPNLLPGPLSPQISLILANVIYFNGKWEYPFSSKHNTWDLFDFYKDSARKEHVRVEMMVNMGRVQYSNSPEAQVLGLPYKGKEVYMYFIVPRNPNLDDFTRYLNYDKFSNLVNNTIEAEVIFSIPKLKITSSMELRPILNAMNVTSMFDISRADLSNMLVSEGGPGVAVDQVFHKVNIDINESGTEAAASTGIIITRISKPIVKVNRPFIFFIYHKSTNSIVFWGSMYKPDPHRPV